MYPVFHAPRTRLPSVLSVFGPIEQYQADRDKRSLFSGNTGAVLEPLDAYLAHLLVNVHPREPRVFAVGGPLPGDRRAYRGAVEEFLQQRNIDLSLLHWLSYDEMSAALKGETDVLVFLAANRPAVDAEVEQWLNLLPSAIVLVFGLGAVGSCTALDAL